MTSSNLGPRPVPIDELIYRSYIHQRVTFPHVEPSRWAKIYENAEAMEKRFKEESRDGN
jgi:hypothetical protein